MTPYVHAEQAALGAVLLDPAQLDRLSPWLRPEHFSRPAHAAVYAAMLQLHANGHPALDRASGDPVPLSWLTDTITEANRHTRGLTAAFPHLLVSACPKPAHASVYGRMVLEAAIHRSVARHATRLHQAARADALRGDVAETLHHAQVLSEALTDLAHSWGTDPRPVTPPPQQTPNPAPPHAIDEAQLADEELLLGCLSSTPHRLHDAIGWLHPDDFADAGHQQIYRCLGALHHRGEPIDQLTVLWEAQRRGALADGTLDTARVLRVCGPLAGDGTTEHRAEQVVQSALLRTAATTARQVRALADQDALAPGQLIGYALHTLGPLDDVHRRWRIATGADPAPSGPGTRSLAERAEAARSRSPSHSTRRPQPTTPAATAPQTAARPGRRSHA